ncbi:uncharacterized protein UDID_19200 [Ustilago sp. UG-2017a]|nr:uncharacterized protein UDID_19200 [Ustilago sp. UG-2017a]
MTDPNLNNKLDRLLALLEAQLELTRQGQREEQLRRAHLTEEATDLSHSGDQAGGGDESMIGDPHTPTPAPRSRPSVSFNLDEQDDVDYEKYASPTGPRYVKSRVDPYNKSRMEHYALDQEEDTSIMTERSKPIATPFPKFNPRDVEIFILEAEAWFKFNQVYEQSMMINHMGAQLEGNARKWMEAYNKLLALRLTSDAPGVATRHVEQFRDLEGQVNLDDNELVIDLFRGSLTCSLQEKFEQNPPNKRWEWYREVEEIDRQRMLLQQASARHSPANNASSPGTRPIQSSIPVWRSAAQPNSTRSPVQPYQLSQPYQHLPHSNNRPLLHQPTPAPKGAPAPSGGSNNTCHVCKGIGHWARDCPSRRVDSLGSRPMGPKVMVVTQDPFDEATDSGDGHSGNTEPEQEDMDLWPYQQHMVPDHEDKQDDDNNEGNISGSQILSSVSIGTHNLGVVEASVADTADYDLILGFTELRKLKPTIQWDTGQLEFKTQEQDRPLRRPPEAARAGDPSMRRPTLHGNEFVSAECILQAALEDGPIGFMLLEVSPSSLLAFGFVPTGADKGVEMEVEVDKEVTTADIPKLYQHLRDVFDEVEADKLPHHTEHDLHLELLEGGKPPQGPLYLKGPKEMTELRRYLDENLKKGFIRPSKSPARSPVLFVPKKDGGLRLCVDYRGLNEITVKNRAPLPLIEEQLFLLRKARIYTKLDLRAAYNLIRIAKGDEWKTAFGTQLGLYEYLVMPFGLANAPAHFQSFINDIFGDIIGVYVVVYLDDFLIFSNTEESHVKHVTEVLTRLRSNRLFAKLSKCEFHTKTVEILGYIIKPTGIEMDPGKEIHSSLRSDSQAIDITGKAN